MQLELNTIRNHFPFLKQNCIYFDTASSSQKPTEVIQTITDVYTNSYANIHRGAYPLADSASEKYEAARKTIAHFLNAQSKEIVFTKNTTESLNFLAQSITKAGLLSKEDTILLSVAEHHSNITPWLTIAKEIGCAVKYIDIDPQTGRLDLSNLEELLQDTKVIALSHTSNVMGYTNDLQTIFAKAKEVNPDIISIVDGCQTAAHRPIDIQEIDCDFYCISSHKMYGPSGVGALFGKYEPLKKLPSITTGGGMVHEVFTDHFTEGEVPQKFEAGTPPIAEAIAFAEAAKFLQAIGLDNIQKFEQELTSYCIKQLQEISEIEIISDLTATSTISINCKFTSNFNIADSFADNNICVRVGHHCCQPLIDRLGYKNLLRISFGIYNTKEEIDQMITVLKETINDFS